MTAAIIHRNKRLEGRVPTEREILFMDPWDQAQYDALRYYEWIEGLTSLHRAPVYEHNWAAISGEAAPPIPEELFGRQNLKGRKAVKGHARQMESYLIQQNAWELARGLGRRVLGLDGDALLEAIQFFNPLSEICPKFVKDVRYDFSRRGAPFVDVFLDETAPLPSVEIILSPNRRRTVKKMQAARFHKLEQDFVSGCALRVGNEILGLLPVKHLVVTILDTGVNLKTGHIETNPILSAAISRNTIRKINLEAADPSEAIGNFVLNVNFKKTQGFSRVSRLEVSALSGG